MTYSGELIVKCISAASLILLFYGWILPLIGKLSTHVARIPIIAGSISWARANDISKLMLAVLSQLMFVIIFISLLDIDLHTAFNSSVKMIGLGVALGVAQMGMVSLIVHLFMHCAMVIAPKASPNSIPEWVNLSKGGWMREYHNTIRTLPLYLSVLIVFAYVAVEEILFRASLLIYLQEFGPFLAILFSTIIFVTVQIFHTPKWTVWIFPVIGALVVGPTNALLFLSNGDVLPLIIAHVVFFLIAVI